MKRSSSSWDIFASSFVLKKRETSFFHWEKRKFSGVSTQYEVTVPHHGAITVFAQNTSISTLHHDGDQVWLSWAIDHAFGLADEAEGEPVSRFHADLDTTTIAVQTRKDLEAELEEA